MLIVRDLGIEIGARRILNPVSFTVGNGEKVGLVGRNGAGKSTLLSVLLGDTPSTCASTGSVQHQGTLSHLPQEPVPGGLGVEPIGLSHVLSARGLDQLDADMQHARHELAADPTEETIERFTALEEAVSRARRLRGRVRGRRDWPRDSDSKEDLLLEDLDSLSGGQRRRVDLMRVLYEQPETMVLDEPTNHLDKAAKRWLFDELDRFRGTVLVISHDLPLLDKSIDRVLALREGQLREYKGNYTKFLELEEERRLSEEKLAAHQDEQIDRFKKLADSMRGQTEKRARLAKVLDRKVEKLQDNRVEVTKKERKVTFKLPMPPRSGDVPMTVEHVAVRYGSLEGPEGRELHHPPRRPHRHRRTKRRRQVVDAALSRGHAEVPRGRREVRRQREGRLLRPGERAARLRRRPCSATSRTPRCVTEVQRRSLLGAFGLKGSAAHQMPGTLSGGERAKLALAILAVVGREPPPARRTHQQPRPGERRGAGRDDAPVEGHDRRGEPRTRIRRDAGADPRRHVARGVLRPVERRLHGPHRATLDP